MLDVPKSKAIVEGVNLVSKHTKPNAENPKGGIIKKEAPIHISNLKVIDGAGNATRIGKRIAISNKPTNEKQGLIIRPTTHAIHTHRNRNLNILKGIFIAHPFFK